MSSTNLSFEKFAQEAHAYINKLAEDLGHPDESDRVLRIWRAVMHTVRDRIHMGESMQIIQSLPTILKGIYAERWQYREKPPLDYKTIEEMKNEVKKNQRFYGEEDFEWEKPTEQIIFVVLNSLKDFGGEERFDHIRQQMPLEIRNFLDK